MAEISDTLTINGTTYRTEAAHEQALREAVAAIKHGANAGTEPSDVAVAILARLDGLRKAVDAINATPPLGAPDAVSTIIGPRLDMIRKALEQLARTASEGTTPTPVALTARLNELEAGQQQTREKVLAGVIKALDLLHLNVVAHLEPMGKRFDALDERFDALEEQQALLLELLDTATAPPPLPTRVPPRLSATPRRTGEVPADPIPFPGNGPLLDRFLADPTLTCQQLANEYQKNHETIRRGLFKMAALMGQEEVLRARMRDNMLVGRSLSAAAGAALPPSTPAGSST